MITPLTCISVIAQRAAENALKPGQIGLQCANICSSTRGNFYIHSCSCTADNGCELFDFTKNDYDTFIGNSDCYPTETAACTYAEGDAPKDAYDYINHTATQNAHRQRHCAVWTGSASAAAASRRVIGRQSHARLAMPETGCPACPPVRPAAIATIPLTRLSLVIN